MLGNASLVAFIATTDAARAKELAQQRLQRIGLQIHQTQQQLLLRRTQLPLTAPSTLALTLSPFYGFVLGVHGGIGHAKRLMQHPKLFVRQSGHRQQLPAVFFQSLIFKHQPILAYFA